MPISRPVPQLLLCIRDPVDGEQTDRDFLALPLSPESLDELDRRMARARDLFRQCPDLMELAFPLPNAVWYAGYHHIHGWCPDISRWDGQQSDDPGSEDVPDVIRAVCMEEIQALAHPLVTETFDLAGSDGAGAKLRVRKTGDDLWSFIEAGASAITGLPVMSDPLSEALIAEARLYWAPVGEIEERWKTLASLSPSRALDRLETGDALPGPNPEPEAGGRPLAPHISREALVPFLNSEDRDIRTRAVVVAPTMSPEPPRRGRTP